MQSRQREEILKGRPPFLTKDHTCPQKHNSMKNSARVKLQNIHRGLHIMAACFVGMGMAFIFSNKVCIYLYMQCMCVPRSTYEGSMGLMDGARICLCFQGCLCLHTTRSAGMQLPSLDPPPLPHLPFLFHQVKKHRTLLPTSIHAALGFLVCGVIILQACYKHTCICVHACTWKDRC